MYTPLMFHSAHRCICISYVHVHVLRIPPATYYSCLVLQADVINCSLSALKRLLPSICSHVLLLWQNRSAQHTSHVWFILLFTCYVFCTYYFAIPFCNLVVYMLHSIIEAVSVITHYICPFLWTRMFVHSRSSYLWLNFCFHFRSNLLRFWSLCSLFCIRSGISRTGALNFILSRARRFNLSFASCIYLINLGYAFYLSPNCTITCITIYFPSYWIIFHCSTFTMLLYIY